MNADTAVLAAMNGGLLLWAVSKSRLGGRRTPKRPVPAARQAVWAASLNKSCSGLEVTYLGTEGAYDAVFLLVQRPNEFDGPVELVRRAVSHVLPCSVHLFRETDHPILSLPGTRLEITWSSLAGSKHLELIDIESMVGAAAGGHAKGFATRRPDVWFSPGETQITA